MPKQSSVRPWFPLALIFVIAGLLLMIIPQAWLDALWYTDRWVLAIGNLVLFAVTMYAFVLYRRSLQKSSPHAFLRLIYGAIFAKMMLCILAALVYVVLVGKEISRGALFGFMLLYFLYTYTEVSIILRMGRKNPYVEKRSAP